jgi:hypothetical protein
MNLNLLIKYLDGSSKDLTTSPADIVAFESKFDMSVARLQESIRLTHIFFLAWHIAQRTKATALDFDAWLETVETVELAPVKK